MNDILGWLNKQPEVLDVKTKEGYEKALKMIDELRGQDMFTRLFFGEGFLDNLEKAITNIHNEANKQEIVQPSTLVTDAQRTQVQSLVDEYVDNIIQPAGKFNADVVKSIKNSLLEFGCWIINK